jgi:hypothetical protein
MTDAERLAVLEEVAVHIASAIEGVQELLRLYCEQLADLKKQMEGSH